VRDVGKEKGGESEGFSSGKGEEESGGGWGDSFKKA
jgi:hypothetical protein